MCNAARFMNDHIVLWLHLHRRKHLTDVTTCFLEEKFLLNVH